MLAAIGSVLSQFASGIKIEKPELNNLPFCFAIYSMHLFCFADGSYWFVMPLCWGRVFHRGRFIRRPRSRAERVGVVWLVRAPLSPPSFVRHRQPVDCDWPSPTPSPSPSYNSHTTPQLVTPSFLVTPSATTSHRNILVLPTPLHNSGNALLPWQRSDLIARRGSTWRILFQHPSSTQLYTVSWVLGFVGGSHLVTCRVRSQGAALQNGSDALGRSSG